MSVPPSSFHESFSEDEKRDIVRYCETVISDCTFEERVEMVEDILGTELHTITREVLQFCSLCQE